MRNMLIILLISGICIAGSNSYYEQTELKSDLNSHSKDLVLDDNFDIMMSVLTHKRCMNCHPSGDRPLQGDDSHIHNFNIQRGDENKGMANVQCSTCHQDENNDYSGVPGAPHWQLAPASMAWEGMSRVEIATAMLDETKNGGRSLEDIESHLTEDALVLWAFDPGVNNEGVPREKPPVTKEEFVNAVKAWVASGASIPSE